MPERSAVEAIVTRFLGRVDELVETSAGAIAQTIPSYARSGEPLMGDVREAMKENVMTLGLLLSQDRELGPEEIQVIERVGAKRAEAGIPLDDVLHAYRTVFRACWDILGEECRAEPECGLDAAIELGQAVLKYTDEISTVCAEAYARAQRAIVREQEGARREFLADLLYGRESSPEDILRRALAFGYDLSLSYIALVGCGPEGEARKESSVANAAATVAELSADSIVLQKDDQTIALLPADPFADPESVPEKLVAELGGGWCFGMGGPEPGLEGIRRAYLEAREALEIGTALDLAGPVYRFTDLLLYHFLRIDRASLDRFIEEVLGPVIAYDTRRKGELLKTLQAYFDADGSVKVAGETLFAHPHTITYRLKQIERLAGWSLRNPEDKLRLQLALRGYRLAQARRDSEG